MSADDYSDLPEPALLPPEESLDDDELGDFDAVYTPPDQPQGLTAWGITERQLRSHEDLAHRLAREEPEPADVYGDGLGDTTDTDGELRDDQVGDLQAGQLTEWEPDLDGRSDFWAHVEGADNGVASAEEDAVHVVADLDERDG